MFRSMAGRGLLIVAVSAAGFAQKVEGPTFEVASIKPAAPMQPGMMRMGRGGGPGTTDPGQVTMTNMSLKDVIVNAYGVKRYQVSGPDWIDSQRFDIQAKVPAGATKEDVNLMWQNLLKERFGLALHHETKDMPMFALVVAKGGPKLKESVVDPNAPAALGPPPGGPNAPPPSRPAMGKDGMPQIPDSMRRPGAFMMMMMPGRMRLMATGATITDLTENLNRQMDRPVNDQTGLTKKYDITLDFSPEGMMRGMPAGPPPGAMIADGHGGGGGAGRGDAGMVSTPDGGEAPTLPVALQEQLGLKLEAKKGPVDLLVIDHLDKSPTEN